jgi:hypothetical protein
MTVRERISTDERDRLVAELLQKYPPIGRLEQLMGPEPTADEADEMEVFLRARSRWQQPYPAPEAGKAHFGASGAER